MTTDHNAELAAVGNDTGSSATVIIYLINHGCQDKSG